MSKRPLLLVCFAIFMCSIVGGVHAAERLSVIAALDAECGPLPAALVVPSGKKAVRLEATLSSSWLPCRGGGHVGQIGFTLESPTGAVLARGVRLFRDQPGPEEGDIAALELAPGSYPITITEGGPETKAVITYELIGVKQPTEGILPAGTEVVQPVEPVFIGGEWSDPETGSRATIIQNGAAITITNRFKREGKAVEWRGEGKIEGARVEFEFTYGTSPPSGLEDGTMELLLVNPKRLAGFWKSASQRYMRNIRFDLVRPAKKKPPKKDPPKEGGPPSE